MRSLLLLSVFLVACAKPEPAQDPLDYLRVGIDPAIEAQAVMRDLEADGYVIGRRIDAPQYFAFDASRGAESTVRLLTYRGPTFSVQTPDARAPHLAAVALASAPWPDFDRDGLHDVIIAMRELDRTCLSWLEIDNEGFVSEVFRPDLSWGDAPCVLDIDVTWPRLLIEVTVPNQPNPEARVRLPVYSPARGWALDETPSAIARWDREITEREAALEMAKAQGDTAATERIGTELAWLEELHAPAEVEDAGVPDAEPVLEAAEDGEEAR